MTRVELHYTQGDGQQDLPKKVKLTPSVRRLLPDSLFLEPFPGRKRRTDSRYENKSL